MSDHQGKRVLVVDDNYTNLTIFKKQLQQWGLVPVIATSGKAALKMLDSGQHFDLMLSDMQMPEMDGVQLVTTVRKSHPVLPIMLLSSVGDENSKQNRQLFNAILTKPVRQHALSKQILNLLEKNDRENNEDAAMKTVDGLLSDKYPFNILVAEDNLINQQVITHLMSRIGYQIKVVDNGLLALEAASTEDFDIILMDMQMPEMDGLEATKRIRNEQMHQPVIIALTANAMQGDREICLAAGMNDYLAKPIKLEELVGMLEKWSEAIPGKKNLRRA
ncbi:MAG: response regulator [Gemmatimonadaceae bacterium]|nr:response regulator [Chitinophagaceae bacterium]